MKTTGFTRLFWISILGISVAEGLCIWTCYKDIFHTNRGMIWWVLDLICCQVKLFWWPIITKLHTHSLSLSLTHTHTHTYTHTHLPWWLSNNWEFPTMQETSLLCGRSEFDPWVRRIPAEGNGKPLQYSCLRNAMDRGAWQATVHWVALIGHDLTTKSPPYTHTHTHTHIFKSYF